VPEAIEPNSRPSHAAVPLDMCQRVSSCAAEPVLSAQPNAFKRGVVVTTEGREVAIISFKPEGRGAVRLLLRRSDHGMGNGCVPCSSCVWLASRQRAAVALRALEVPGAPPAAAAVRSTPMPQPTPCRQTRRQGHPTRALRTLHVPPRPRRPDLIRFSLPTAKGAAAGQPATPSFARRLVAWGS
jgi:hypothetical protein